MNIEFKCSCGKVYTLKEEGIDPKEFEALPSEHKYLFEDFVNKD